MKTLVISHAHPDFSVGGAEIAAYNLYCSLLKMEEVSQATFLARTDTSELGHGNIKLYRENEYLWRQGIGDWFRLRTENIESILDEFRAFLQLLSPDVIFVQHYVHIGVELFREVKRTLPKCFVAATLHEYLAICNRNGQFVKNKSKKLCYKESPAACSECFPEYSSNDFWLRKHYIRSHFENVDVFISPSHFLMQRYIDWGIPSDRIVFIENGQPKRDEKSFGANHKSNRVRFGFFGQVNEYKGVEILLQAMQLMDESERKKIAVEIHGANLETQGQWYQDLIEDLRAPLLKEGCLRWVGPYEPHELQRRMGKVDWVVVPSIWWENSPMVIQEAFVSRRPVICANIGGMAEKVRNGIDGLHFEVRNPLDLSNILVRAATEEGLWQQLWENLPMPPSYAECAAEHLAQIKMRAGGHTRLGKSRTLAVQAPGVSPSEPGS